MTISESVSITSHEAPRVEISWDFLRMGPGGSRRCEFRQLLWIQNASKRLVGISAENPSSEEVSMYQNHKLQKLLFGEKMVHAVFCVSAVFKDGFTELAGRKNGVDSVDSGGPSVVLGGSLGPFGCSSILYHYIYYIYTHLFYQIY